MEMDVIYTTKMAREFINKSLEHSVPYIHTPEYKDQAVYKRTSGALYLYICTPEYKDQQFINYE